MKRFNRSEILISVTFALIIGCWICAWELYLMIGTSIASGWPSFIYWTVAKLIIWICPSIMIINVSNKKLRDFVNRPSRKSVIWGLGSGGILVLTNFIAHLSGRGWLLTSASASSLANAIIVAPVFEEFIMRGVIFEVFREKRPFWLANSITALLFVVLHLPGWYFTGNLHANLLSGAAVSIFLIGWMCGLAKERGGHIASAVITHLLNNLMS